MAKLREVEADPESYLINLYDLYSKLVLGIKINSLGQ